MTLSALEQLQASFEEFKASSAAVEEDLEYEISSFEKLLAQKELELAHTKQALANAQAKIDQSRDQFKRQTLSLEKQVDAFELSTKRLTEERRKLEQQKDDLERTNRVLQTQCEEQSEMCELLLEKEAVTRLGLEDLEVNFHRAKLEHESSVIKLKAAFKLLYAQVVKLGQSPAIQLPDATTEELAEMDAERPGAEVITREAREGAFRKFVEVVTTRRLQDQLASTLVQLEQAKRRIGELELEVNESPRGSESLPELTEEKTLREGFLTKRGEGTLASWKRQLFRINNDTHALEYYFVQVRKGNTKRIKLGEIPLPQASITVAQKEGSHDNLFHLKPRNSKRTYVLQAASSEERNLWLSALSPEMLLIPKVNPESIAEAQFRIDQKGGKGASCFCILLKHEMQLFHHQGDEKPFKVYSLKDCQMAYLPSEKNLLAFDYGAGLKVKHVILDCGTAEKLGEWTSHLENLIAQQRDGYKEPAEVEIAEVDLTVPLKGPLRLMQKDKWEEYFFAVSSDTNFLDFFPNAGASGGNPVGTIPLLSTRQDGTSTAIISSYPSEAYGEHVFGITPPFSSVTWLLEASSKQVLVNWMDGLVTLLDGKVARDPFSAKEGYLYKAVKDSTQWGKKYVMLDPPDVKYYKAGRHTNATVLTLTHDSQILLRPPSKRFPVVFSLSEGPGSREFLWGSRDQLEGETWVSALQAVITKCRNKNNNNSYPNAATPAKPLAPLRAPTEDGKNFPRQVTPRSAKRRTNSLFSTPTRTRLESSHKDVQTEKIATAAVEFAAIVRQKTEGRPPPPASSPSPQPPGPPPLSPQPGASFPSPTLSSRRFPPSLPPLSPSLAPMSPLPPLSPLSSSLPTSMSSLKFSFNFHQPRKSGTLQVLKTSLFSTARWTLMTFELSHNGRVLTYSEAEKETASQEGADRCPVAGCSRTPFERFGGLCAHHRKSTKKKPPSLWYLVGAEVEVHTLGHYPGHAFTFSLSGPGGPPMVIEAPSSQERAEWAQLLTESGLLKRFIYPDSIIEGRLGQLCDGAWKEKYYVVRQGRFECYHRSNQKRAWEVPLKATTQVRAEELTQGKACTNADRTVEAVFVIIQGGKEQIVLGVFPGDSRDAWIDALQSCIAHAALA